MNKFNFDDLKESFGGLRLSLLEGIVFALALAFAIAVGYFYYTTTQPLHARLEYLRKQETTLKDNIKDESVRKQKLKEQQENAEKILDSLDSFEGRLRNRKVGIPAIIDEVNLLAKSNRVLAGDITFQSAKADPLPQDAVAGASPTATPKIKTQERLLNVYEGLGIDTTVEGDYHDLRRFISALEHSRNFVIINAISLQSVDEKRGAKAKIAAPRAGNSPQLGPPGMPQNVPMAQPGGDPNMPLDSAAPTKTIVSLKLEMETHFSREQKFEPAAKPIPANAPATTTKQ